MLQKLQFIELFVIPESERWAIIATNQKLHFSSQALYALKILGFFKL